VAPCCARPGFSRGEPSSRAEIVLTCSLGSALLVVADLAAAPARCRSGRAGGVFNRALTTPRVAVAVTRPASGIRLADQRRQTRIETMGRAICPAWRLHRGAGALRPESRPVPTGTAGDCAWLFATALTPGEPETNSTPAGADRPSDQPVRAVAGGRARRHPCPGPRSLSPPGIATPVIRWAPTVGRVAGDHRRGAGHDLHHDDRDGADRWADRPWGTGPKANSAVRMAGPVNVAARWRWVCSVRA
jgi:hypothetical protein